MKNKGGPHIAAGESMQKSGMTTHFWPEGGVRSSTSIQEPGALAIGRLRVSCKQPCVRSLVTEPGTIQTCEWHWDCPACYMLHAWVVIVQMDAKLAANSRLQMLDEGE